MSLELLRGLETFIPAVKQICSWTKNILQISSPPHVFSVRRNHKKNPVILLSSHTTAQEVEVWGRHGGNPQTKPKIITSYKFIGSFNSSNMMLYTYMDVRQTVCY
jgi:hypothetical protein